MNFFYKIFPFRECFLIKETVTDETLIVRNSHCVNKPSSVTQYRHCSEDIVKIVKLECVKTVFLNMGKERIN